MNSKQKYLKYKQKYLNLKKMIGGGIDATYTISLPDKISILNYFDLFGIARKIKPGNILILKYLKKDGTTNKIRYNIIKKIGEGSYGIIYLIENIDTTEQYIFKYGKNKKGNDIYNEGKDSDILKDILDNDNMIPLFQGTSQSDFLISTYNGNNLYEEFKDNPHKINFANITIKLLELLHKINDKQIFHNDIKLENITIKGDEVYLIDFGLLTKDKSSIGPIISMSYNGIIALLQQYNYTHYNDIFPKLDFVNNTTDIVGFFYCCIDLLFLLNNSMYYSSKLLNELQIKNLEEADDVYRLFSLFYFILPTNKRKEIPELNDNLYSHFDKLLPNITETKNIFSSYPKEHTNLFRFMAYIYNIIKHDVNNETQHKWYIEFLRIMSDCFLPTFNYEDFKPQFKTIVLQFKTIISHFEIPII